MRVASDSFHIGRGFPFSEEGTPARMPGHNTNIKDKRQ